MLVGIIMYQPYRRALAYSDAAIRAGNHAVEATDAVVQLRPAFTKERLMFNKSFVLKEFFQKLEEIKRGLRVFFLDVLPLLEPSLVLMTTGSADRILYMDEAGNKISVDSKFIVEAVTNNADKTVEQVLFWAKLWFYSRETVNAIIFGTTIAVGNNYVTLEDAKNIRWGRDINQKLGIVVKWHTGAKFLLGDDNRLHEIARYDGVE
jgi:hypothetical protein